MEGIFNLKTNKLVLVDSKNILIPDGDLIHFQLKADDGDPLNLSLSFIEKAPEGEMSLKITSKDDVLNLELSNVTDGGNSQPVTVGHTDKGEEILFYFHVFKHKKLVDSDPNPELRRVHMSFYKKMLN